MGESEGGVLEMCQNSEIYMKIFYFKIPSKHNPSDVKMYVQGLPVSALINRPSSGHVYTGVDNLRARSCPCSSSSLGTTALREP
jgi:hypothetical protein